MRLGLIADTHGYLGDDAREALRRCDHILHAGDVGPGVLEGLSALAPLTAVRGNNDTTGAEAELPELAHLAFEGRRLALVHRLVDAPPGGWDVLIYGHCHRQHADTGAGGRLLANPGAAGRRGFHTSRSVAILHLTPETADVEFIDLGPRSAARLPALATSATGRSAR